MKKKLFILDDDLEILNALKDFLGNDDTELMLESDSEAAIDRIKAERPNVAIMDITFPKKSGLEVLREIKGLIPSMQVIMTTGNLTTQNAIEAMKHGAYDYLTKPFDMTKLEDLVNKAFQASCLHRTVYYARERLPATLDESETDIMIGSSPEMTEIWKMVGTIADTDASLLIQGESGTGKELLARAIYLNSKRRNKPFLAVNCAAIPETLMESELFGHEKWAFTDAVGRRIGKFEKCDGGTLFLDEIGELSLANQGKLLRVLDAQKFERVGGNESIKTDVRIITATNRSLINAVKENRFRLDLFYRLKVVSFFLPPLRERKEDIPLLIDLFIRKFSREYNKPVKQMSTDAMKLLLAYPWNGNIRELKNVMNSAFIFNKGNNILPEDFGPLLQASAMMAGTEVGSGDELYILLKPLFDKISAGAAGSVYEKFTADTDRVLFQMTMAKFNDNQVQAARFLGISRNMLRKKLGQFKLD